MGRERGPEHEHAVLGRRPQAGADGHSSGRSDRRRLQRWARIRRSRQRRLRAGEIHLRVRGRDDPGLDADGPQRLVDGWPWSPSTPARPARSSAGSRSRAGSCTRRTSTTTASSSSTRTGAASTRPGAFVDREKPDWYAPFGIQAIGDRIFVTYAYRAPVNGNDAPHGGYVDEFDLDGRLLAHVGTPTSWTSRGASRSRRAHSAASAAISSSRTSAAADQRVPAGRRAAGRSRAGCR